MKEKTQTNYENTAEKIARSIENDEMPKEISKWYRHVQEIFDAVDIMRPDVIRTLYPLAAKFVADDEQFLKEYETKHPILTAKDDEQFLKAYNAKYRVIR